MVPQLKEPHRIHEVIQIHQRVGLPSLRSREKTKLEKSIQPSTEENSDAYASAYLTTDGKAESEEREKN